MNGEVAQMSGIVMSARKALLDSEEIEFDLEKYVLSVRFVFAPRENHRRASFERVSVQGWFDSCKRLDLEDIKLFLPTRVKDRHILGFSNSSCGSIVCFWKEDLVTYFVPKWKFDKDHRGWHILYEEHIWETGPKGKPSFCDKSQEFMQVLLEIEKLARELQFEYFATVFHGAYEALAGVSDRKEDPMPAYIPEEFRGINYAVRNADVFGAMGSWNDSPPYYAREKGLEKEYDELSDRLLEQLRYHLMYMVNESWK